MLSNRLESYLFNCRLSRHYVMDVLYPWYVERYILLHQETRSCFSAKVYARDRLCIYTRTGELRALEIIRSQ